MPVHLPDHLPDPVMSPGTYLRLRRLAAGLTPDMAARLSLRGAVTATPGAVATRREAITDFEAGRGNHLHHAALAMDLARAFRFDQRVLDVLTEHALDPASELPVPLICTSCGCSWEDPCHNSDFGPCSWRPGSDQPGQVRCCYCPPITEQAA